MEIIKSEDRKGKILSFLIAALAASRFLISWLSNYGGVGSSGLLVMGSIWGIYSYYKIKYGLSFKVRAYSALVIAIVVIMLLFSYMTSSGHIKDLIVLFFQYCFIGYLIGGTSFNFKTTCSYVNIILILLSYPIYQILRHDMTMMWHKSITMDHSYFLLPLIMFSFTHYLLYRKNSTFFDKIAYIIAIVVFAMLIMTGTRGAVLSILFFFLGYYLNTSKGYQTGIYKRLILILILVVLTFAMEHILIVLNSILSIFSINIGFISRNLDYILQGDLSNGRMELYLLAINGFLRSPIIGNGIGSFADKYPLLGYPHNMLLQFMYEGGGVLALPFIIIVIGEIKYIYFDMIGGRENRIMHCLFFSTAIIPAMLSNEPWVYPLLWCYFGIVLHQRKQAGAIVKVDTKR